MTTQIVKIPTSNKWEDSMIESLKNKQHCAVYLESSLEEKNVENLVYRLCKDISAKRFNLKLIKIQKPAF
jgi:DNA-binding phage protein